MMPTKNDPTNLDLKETLALIQEALETNMHAQNRLGRTQYENLYECGEGMRYVHSCLTWMTILMRRIDAKLSDMEKRTREAVQRTDQ